MRGETGARCLALVPRLLPRGSAAEVAVRFSARAEIGREQDFYVGRVFHPPGLAHELRGGTILLMTIVEFVWAQDRIEHIARHGVTPDEVEEVCFGRSFVQRARSEGPNPVYYVLGQTDAGRYLLCVIISFPEGKGYPVTARQMTEKEKRRYRNWKSR